LSKQKVFYVYGLFRPDPDGSICYIGKGKKNRWRVSARAARSRNKALARLIKDAGGELPATIIRDGLTEQQAFRYEIALIASIGRKPDGLLLNLTDGGDGGAPPTKPTWNKQTHPEIAEMARARALAYWARRRALGLPMVHRDVVGHRKHGKRLRAINDFKRRSGSLPKITKNSIVIRFNNQTMNLFYACQVTGLRLRALRHLIEFYRLKPQAAFDLCITIKRKLMGGV
jgi:hypothetical protein